MGKPLSRKLQSILEGPAFLYFLFALITRTLLSGLYFSPRGDKMKQLYGAINLWKGKGLTLDLATVQDIFHASPVFLKGWPPAYSWLVMPLVPFAERNRFLLSLAGDLLINAFFLWAVWRVLSYIGVEKKWVHLFLLFSGCFLYIFTRGTSTEIWGVAMILLVLEFTLRLLSLKEKNSIHPVLHGFLTYLMSLVRYQYQPFIIVPGLYLLWMGLFRKDTALTRKALISLLSTVSFFAVYALMVPVTIGGGDNIPGFFPSSWMTFYPFTVTALMEPDPLPVFLENYFQLPYEYMFGLYQSFSWIVTLILLTWMLANFSTWIKSKMVFPHFLLLGGAFFFGTLGLLLGLSLFFRVYDPPGTVVWTYVHEVRYFGWPVVFLQILLVCWLSGMLFKPLPFLRKIVLSLAAISMLHSFYFIGKHLLTKTYGEHELEDYSVLMKEVRKEIKKLKEDTGKPVAVFSYMDAICIESSLDSATAIIGNTAILDPGLHADQAGTILFATEKKYASLYYRFLNRKEVHLLKETADWQLYGAAIQPGYFYDSSR
jgi:hypothetical protein